ncbi:MAG: flippase [Acidobacteria bacterium]|nr:flippase [Acidobacteriota bacterium]
MSPGSSGRSSSPALLARNSLILIGVEVLAKGLGLLVFVPMARIVGAADLGMYAFAVSLSNLAALLPRFGFERFVQRELPRAPQAFPRSWSAIIAAKTSLSAIAVGGVLFTLWLGRLPAAKSLLVLLILLSTLLYDVVRFHAACFRAFQRAEYEAGVRLGFSGLYVILGLLVLWAGWGVAGIALVLVTASATALAHSAWLLHLRIHPLKLSVEPSAVGAILKESFPLFLLGVVVLLYNQVDVVLLSFLSGDREVGIYAAAMKIYEAAPLIPAGVMGAVLPVLARDWAVSRERFAATFGAAFRYLGMLSLPLAVGGTICAAAMVQLLYGLPYGPSAGVLRILIWAAIFSFWNHLLFGALIAMDRERTLLMIGAFGVVANVTFNLLLVPRYGALGSGTATVVTEALLFLLVLRPILRQAGHGADLAVSLLRPALSTAIMAALLWAIRGRSLALLVPVGIAVYSAGLWASGAVHPAQVRAVLGRGGD